MPVISPRRSSATSSSFYVSPTTSASTELSGHSSSSYLDRNSLSKASSTSYSSSSYGHLNSYSYLPRISSTYRSVGSSSSSSPSSYTTGGISKYSSYRSPSSYLSSDNDSTVASRYGLKTKSKIQKDPLKNNGNHETNKTSNSVSDSSKSNNRLSSSYSSSSLARLVATSGLDIYEKYSPAHYIPKCEISRSRSSVSDATVSAVDSNNADESKDSTSKPASRFSRLSSRTSNDDTTDEAGLSKNRPRSNDQLLSSSITSNSLKKPPHNNNANTLNDTSIPTYTIRSNRLRKQNIVHINDDDDDENVLKNGSAEYNNVDRLVSTRNHFKDLNISSTSSLSGVDNKEITAFDSPTATATITITSCTDGSEPKSSDTIISKLDTQLANSSKARSSSSLRSALPPPSPTPSRYWDRESNRTSSLSRSEDQTKSEKCDEKAEGLCGLRNIGNTCFMNSVIQCLSHTSELTKFLKTQNGVKSSSSKDQQILYEFAKLIREMWTTNVHSVTPMELKRAFSTKHRMYSDYNQQDAQEFLRFFLDSLHCALNTGVKGEHLKIDDNLSDNKKADLTWEWYARHENSLIRDLFVGQLKSTLKCTTCGNTSVTFDPFWDLSVSLPSSSRCKLDACLDLFIREEILDGDEMPTCSKCQTRRKCTKSFTIQRFPKYLVIHLKRFSETRWSKLSNIVEFPTGEKELNMGPYGSNHNSNVYYSLYAISNHMGSTAGGHYVALCKHPVSKKWHEFNDNIVSDDLSENHLVSSSAYILFYERA